MLRGRVRWFRNDLGYGFIERAPGDDIFVHYSFIVMDGYKTLEADQEVDYTVATGAKGVYAPVVVPVEKAVEQCQ